MSALLQRALPQRKHVPEIDADFLLIPAGAFYVGGKGDNEGGRRLAAITRPFYMQETPVTQRQYQAVTGTNPAYFQGNPDNPVEMVSWDDAFEFCQQLGSQFRLPTEMEWERAARGGDGDKYTYAGSNNPDEVAWTNFNSNGQTQPVKQLKPNGYGLYDMPGNVREWCSDLVGYGQSYPNQELIDYRGLKGSNRVFRSDCWDFNPEGARVAYRGCRASSLDSPYLGFRLVMDIPNV